MDQLACGHRRATVPAAPAARRSPALQTRTRFISDTPSGAPPAPTVAPSSSLFPSPRGRAVVPQSLPRPVTRAPLSFPALSSELLPQTPPFSPSRCQALTPARGPSVHLPDLIPVPTSCAPPCPLRGPRCRLCTRRFGLASLDTPHRLPGLRPAPSRDLGTPHPFQPAAVFSSNCHYSFASSADRMHRPSANKREQRTSRTEAASVIRPRTPGRAKARLGAAVLASRDLWSGASLAGSALLLTRTR